jgi:hypothetical protein
MRDRHERFDITRESDGCLHIDNLWLTLPDGYPAPALRAYDPPGGWTVQLCLDAATEYATFHIGPAHTQEHRIFARAAFLALLDASHLTKENLMDEMRGIDRWEDRYPRPKANGWDK